jgi:glucan phosphoethanolaminetransferase (alkaline phosphatase superfamily)
MKELDPILKFLKEASIFDIFLISFLLLPFVFASWVTIFEKLGYSPSSIVKLLIVISLVYILFIILMLIGMNKKKKREVIRDQILGYLQSKNFTMMSFERVRERINKTYSDTLLNSVIDYFPNELRRAKLKGGLSGIARIIEESDSAQEA